MNTPRAAYILLLGGIFLSARLAAGAPLTFPAATPISAGNVIFREQPSVNEYSQDKETDKALNVLAYGATHDLAFFLEEYPIQYQQEKSLGVLRHSFGPSDTQSLARYTFWQKDGIGETQRWALIGGEILPTGSFNQSDRYGPLPRRIQPGTGNWAEKGGLAYIQQTLGREVDFYANYVHYDPGGGYQFGDQYTLDGGYQRRLLPVPLPYEGIPLAELFTGVESNFYAYMNDAQAGAALPTTGLTLWQVDPLLRVVGYNWGLSLVGEIPILQHNYGSEQPLKDSTLMLVYRQAFYTYHHW